ncbi:hypothetical protein [Flavobacterium frigidarium]|uniref:hypothetical protein n=1 Tax=Flavobacterium frigidarium TaxID=99286 RepID=UPI00040A7A69|nr:hypothetical protein [Flavobacterium frigidarium]
MAKIYLFGQKLESDKNVSLYYELTYRLKALGHEIFDEETDYGKEQEYSFKKAITSSDIIIPIITSYSTKSKSFLNELVQLRNYTVHRDDKLLLPIVAGKIDTLDFPESLFRINFIIIENKLEEKQIEIAVKKINDSINSFLGKKIAFDEKALEIKEKIEKTAPTYIAETINELNKREKYQKYSAQFWYVLGFIALISGIGVAFWFSNITLSVFNEKENWSLTTFYALKSIFIIILLITSSKYSFTLAKSYMSESLKIADRIHAISFGKFYLQVFNDRINPEDIKEIFRDWNINNHVNNFSNQSASDYDPKIFEKVIEIIDKVRNNNKI